MGNTNNGVTVYNQNSCNGKKGITGIGDGAENTGSVICCAGRKDNAG